MLNSDAQSQWVGNSHNHSQEQIEGDTDISVDFPGIINVKDDQLIL